MPLMANLDITQLVLQRTLLSEYRESNYCNFTSSKNKLLVYKNGEESCRVKTLPNHIPHTFFQHFYCQLAGVV